MIRPRIMYIFLLAIICCLSGSGCSVFKIDTNHENGKLPSSKMLDKFIEDREIENVVYEDSLYDKYTLIVYEDGPDKWGYYITTSYYGRIVSLCSSEEQVYTGMPDVKIERMLSTPKFLLIRISESRLSDIGKIVVRYSVPDNSNSAKEITITSIRKYNLIINADNEEIIANDLDIEIYNSENIIIQKKVLKVKR